MKKHGSKTRIGTLLACLAAFLWLMEMFASEAQGQLPKNPTGGKGKKAASLFSPPKNVVAYVNGEPITRQELAEALIARKGKEQLELLINRKIIEQAARKAGVTVTDEEVEADLKEFIHAANCHSVADFERRVLKRRGMSLFEYREDVIKPAILMRKLGGIRIKITEEELRKAFDAKYGERVQCRIILERNRRAAYDLYHKVKGDPAEFIRYAKQQADPNLAAVAGKINPIGRGTSYEIVEDRAFSMKDGEISEVLQVPEGNVILLREKLIPPDATKKFEEERDALRQELLEKKLKVEVPKLFKELRSKAVVRDYLNGRFDIKQILEELGQSGANETPTGGR